MAAWDDDLLGRGEVAIFLQNLLESDEDIKVINIDSPWGTGKTFFLENWKAQLENDRGVVYFNAWQKDYSGDPFISLVAAIKDQLENQIGKTAKQKSIVNNFKNQASQTFLATAPVALKLLSKGLLKRVAGLDADEASKEMADALDKVSETAIQSVIDSSRDDEEVVERFEITLKALVSEVSKVKSKDKDKPVYILIDELDRCRPTYAIELLERVKHFFSVDGCKFVIATDTSQLQHSIKAIYGSGFNSEEYLKRFFDLDYSLDNNNVPNWIKAKLKCEDSFYCLDLETKKPTRSSISRTGKPPVIPDEDTVWGDGLNQEQAIIIALSKTFNCSLRTIDRILKHLEASLINIKESSVHYFYLAYLVFLKNKDAGFYFRFVNYNPGEDEDLMNEIYKKYRPMKLYFLYDSLHVHQVAADYFRFKGMSVKELKENEEADHQYFERIKEDLWMKKTTLNYERVVSLASKIGVDKK